MGKSPSIILTSQYTIPNKKSFTTYVDYCMRQKALLKDGHTLTNTELTELSRFLNTEFDDTVIQEFRKHLYAFYIEWGLVPQKGSDRPYKVTGYPPNHYPILEDFYKYLSNLKLEAGATPQRHRDLEAIKLQVEDMITVSKYHINISIYHSKQKEFYYVCRLLHETKSTFERWTYINKYRINRTESIAKRN
uniref:PXO2-85 n=1 Tax=Bacillus anthracis TaxID=1392 RepID=Q9RMV0_BACAN|nr:pXO2-85 [Bacillus anthracis]